MRAVANECHATSLRCSLAACVLSAFLGVGGGCITTCNQAIPASQVPPELLAPPRSAQTPIDFTLLQQVPSKEHILGPGDTVGVYVPNVFPPEGQPPVDFPDTETPRYPGQTITPRLGTPVFVDPQGRVQLPDLPPQQVAGLTVAQAQASIAKAYVDAQILKPGRDHVLLALIKPRIYKVTVLREDVEATESIRKDTYVWAKRGSAQVLEMPAYENDVLHALVASGGLPGTDAHAHLWLIRAPASKANDENSLPAPSLTQLLAEGVQAGPGHLICIPLRGYPGEPLPFGPEDVLLRDGDVLYVPSRETEFFYVGGYLSGGQIPLPRDYDLDVLGAIAIANGNIGGPTGEQGATAFRSGPGNIIPPSSAIIVRQFADGRQLKIAVNLKRALVDPRERILIVPGDLVLVQYTMPELMGNVLINFVDVNYAIPSR